MVIKLSSPYLNPTAVCVSMTSQWSLAFLQAEEAIEGPGRTKEMVGRLKKKKKQNRTITSNSQQREFKVKHRILKRAQSISWRVQKNITCHEEKEAA